jgi:hypothetical protein
VRLPAFVCGDGEAAVGVGRVAEGRDDDAELGASLPEEAAPALTARHAPEP